MLEYRYERIMILEDDIRFEPFFRQKLDFVLTELNILRNPWDLM